MRSGTIAFLLGIVSLQFVAELPHAYWGMAMPLAAAGLLRPRLRLPAAYLCGLLWALLHAHWILDHDWPAQCAGRDVLATGVIVSIPSADARRTRFLFRADTLEECAHARLPVRLRLSWYGPAPPLHAGERWQLRLRAKPRNGFFNPGGFDYERWLFQRRIGGLGYVRDRDAAWRLGRAADPFALLQRLRQYFHDALLERLPAAAEAALVPALALGERAGISPAQWQVLRATGTGHLVAISGLHIGLAGGFGWALGLWGWKRSARLCTRVPAQRAALVPMLACALGYAALAGFSIPTQRALLMLLVGVLAQALQRQQRFGRTWFLALLAVLLTDPTAVLSPGFWLSFTAVAVLLYGMGARWSPRGLWWRWGRAQWLVGVGLVPLSLAAFQTLSLAGPLANLVAVPWVSLVVVPLVLGATVLIGPFPDLSQWLLQGACWALSALWPLLERLAALPGATATAAPGWLWLLPAALGCVWFLAPKGFPARPMGLLLLLPLWNPAARPPAEGELELTLLDVGQGLAVVARTRKHVLVYDTGPRLGPTFDAGAAVVAPFLRRLDVHRVDTLVLSHNDGDHSGGYASLRDRIAIDRVLASEPAGPAQTRCVAGQRWRWDGVVFEVLHPGPGSHLQGNDGSCVLRLTAPGGTVLLSGDLQHAGERRLLASGADLRSDVLVAPHHGSAGSSSVSFVAAVAPEWVLFATGYANRYGFPRPPVLARYRGAGAQPLTTADCGAISVDLRPGARRVPVCSRRASGRYWNRP